MLAVGYGIRTIKPKLKLGRKYTIRRTKKKLKYKKRRTEKKLKYKKHQNNDKSKKYRKITTKY